MDVLSIQDRMSEAKSKAGFFLAKRRKDGELYALLSEVMAICEDVERNGLLEQVKDAVKSQPANGRNRSFFLSDPDVYLVVGRAIFEPEVNRGSSWRYTSVMREAAKRQIKSGELAEWLSDNGGLNTLFKGRGVLAEAVKTRTLHLNTSVEISKKKPITLTLKMDHRGFFDVMEIA